MTISRFNTTRLSVRDMQPARPERAYIHQVCARCNTSLGCDIAESMELPTEHGVLIGTGWCNRCQSVQPVLRQRYTPAVSSGTVGVELLGD